MPFQAFGNSRGHRALISDLAPGHRSLLADHPSPFSLSDSEDLEDVESGTTEDISEPVVLGKGNPKNLKFEWETESWNPCSVSCGENGFQVDFFSISCLG